jgi:hypothetical protein
MAWISIKPHCFHRFSTKNLKMIRIRMTGGSGKFLGVAHKYRNLPDLDYFSNFSKKFQNQLDNHQRKG